MAKATKKDQAAAVTEATVEAPKTDAPVVEQAAPVAAVPAAGVSQEQFNELLAMNQRLMASLQLASQGKNAEEPTYRVSNIIGESVSFSVTDGKTGQRVEVYLAGRGDYKNLTRKQIEEAHEKWPWLFDKGLIDAPGAIAANPNAISDLEKFVTTIPFHEINSRIEQITSPETLWAVWNHIETKRFTNVDESGAPLQEKDGEIMRPAIREIQLEPQAMALELAVQRRITALTGVRPHMG